MRSNCALSLKFLFHSLTLSFVPPFVVPSFLGGGDWSGVSILANVIDFMKNSGYLLMYLILKTVGKQGRLYIKRIDSLMLNTS